VDEAAKVMARLTPEQTEKVVLEIASIRRVDPEEATVVLAEFESLLRKAREPSGGLETARTILEGAFGADRAEAMLNKAVPSGGVRPFDYLDGIDPERLRALVADELPAVKALVLSQLEPKLAAAVIARMQPDEKKDTVLRLAKLTSINPEVLRRVDEALREKTMNASATSADSIDGRNALAEILKRRTAEASRRYSPASPTPIPTLGATYGTDSSPSTTSSARTTGSSRRPSDRWTIARLPSSSPERETPSARSCLRTSRAAAPP
jgi:flagellar motor switch protein FliG